VTGPRPSLAEDLALALEMADVADRLTTHRFRASDLKVDTKPDLTPVTEADRGVEEALRKLMAERRPGDAVVGEEYGATGVGARRWIVDPIDGTKNFVRGIPVWASLIALEDAGRPVVGVVSAPALGRRWWAASGLGAFADGSPISVSSVARLEDAQLSYSSLDGWAEQGGTGPLLALGERCWRTRAFGDFWSHVLVAEGAVDIGLDPIVSLWDLAAVQVIVEEAGGRFTDYGGVRTADGGSAVSTKGLLHDEVLRILRPT
jgi:histidinol-phosphatase